MAKENLSDRKIQSLKPAPEGKRKDHYDAVVPGLAVRVTDKKSKTRKGKRRIAPLCSWPVIPANPTRYAGLLGNMKVQTQTVPADIACRSPRQGTALNNVSRVAGEEGADMIIASDQTNDVLYDGGAGTDTPQGVDMRDILFGGDDADTLLGGKGEDTILASTGADIIEGGGDSDTYNGSTFDGAVTGIVADLNAGTILTPDGDVQLVNQIENVVGTIQADSLVGNSKTETLSGRGGDDIIDGGKGDNILTGDAGNDRFVFNKKFGNDTIANGDFTARPGTDDVSDFSALDMTFADLVLSSENGGADTLITTPKDGSVLLEDVDMTTLNQIDDFLF